MTLHSQSRKKFILRAFVALTITSLAPQPNLRAMDSTVLNSYVENNTVKLLATAGILGGSYLAYRIYDYVQKHKPLTWNWDNEHTRKKLSFQNPRLKQPFLWGAATSAQQVEGDCTNNSWHVWEQSVDENGKNRVEQTAGIACDHWNRYKQDIQLLKQIGANSYRFSIEWSKIEPQEGKFDQEALQHYKDVCEELRRNNIRACINLHHYTDPIWFINKGGFEKKENVAHFVDFAKRMIEELNQENTMWFTFNSPDGYATKGWLIGTTYPGKKDMQLCGQVYAHMLEAHVHIYRDVKKTKPNTQLGILKNMLQCDPWNPYNPLDILACSMATKITDTGFFNFFTTGVFELQIPTKANVTHKNKDAIGALDFIGINYYCHGYMKNFKITRDPKETPTDSDLYTIYPEGLYRAIKEVSKKIAEPLKIPMYITENGIATTDDNKREEFLQKYLYALSKAIKDGYDVRGYIHWSLMDNYEWGQYKHKYGIFNVDFSSPNLTRTLKRGSQFYVDTIAANS